MNTAKYKVGDLLWHFYAENPHAFLHVNAQLERVMVIEAVSCVRTKVIAPEKSSFTTWGSTDVTTFNVHSHRAVPMFDTETVIEHEYKILVREKVIQVAEPALYKSKKKAKDSRNKLIELLTQPVSAKYTVTRKSNSTFGGYPQHWIGGTHADPLDNVVVDKAAGPVWVYEPTHTTNTYTYTTKNFDQFTYAVEPTNIKIK